MISEHGSTVGLDGWCVGHVSLLVGYVFLIPMVHVLVAFVFCWPWCLWCRHGSVDGVVVNVLS